MRRYVVLASWSALFLTAPAAAQVCSGTATFTEGSTHVFASIAFGEEQTYRAGAAYGGARLFGWAQAGMATRGEDQTMEYRLGAGVQLSRRAETRLHICPEILLSRRAVTNAAQTTLRLTQLTASLGVDVGYVILRRGSTRIVPTTNVQLVTGQLRTSYINGVRRTNGIRSYRLFGAGIGFGFGEFTAIPSIILPLGQDGAELTYVIGFSVRF